MNKKNKGFTLVELLAIIVILAVILVITVPAVFSSIESSRKKSLENSAKGLADWINKTIEIDKISGTNTIDTNELPEYYDYYALNDDNVKIIPISAMVRRDVEINPYGTIGSKLNRDDYVFYDENVDYDECRRPCYSSILYHDGTNRIEVVLVTSSGSSFYVSSAADDNELMWASSFGYNSWNYNYNPK